MKNFGGLAGIFVLVSFGCGGTNDVEDVAASQAFASAGTSDKFAQVRGFKVEISEAGTGGDVDTAWESVSGGELSIEATDTTIGSDQFATASPGHRTVGEITLQGAMTSKRAALCQWNNDTTHSKLTITELLLVGDSAEDGKSYIFDDCFPVAYVFPRLRVSCPVQNGRAAVTITPVVCDDY